MNPKEIRISKSSLQFVPYCMIFIVVSIGANSSAEVSQKKENSSREIHSSSPAKENLTQKQISQLEALGYLSGYVPPPEQSNVTIYNKEKAYDGLNFFSSLHKPSAYLIDMQGNILHEWSCNINEVWPEKNFEGVPLTGFWRRVYMYPNGDILAIFENIGIVKLDKDSNVIWKNDNRAHHDLEVLDNGDIWVLTNKVKSIPRIGADVSIMEDYLTQMDKNGRILREISLLASLEDSEYSSFMKGRLEIAKKNVNPVFDIFHTNTLEVLDGRVEHILSEFRKGNFLVSFRALHLVAVIDQDTEVAVWALDGEFRGQHDPTIVKNGNLLLFDNVGKGEVSTVLEFDLKTMDVVWSYSGTEEFPFYSKASGTCQRLPNGNTLITESNSGRAFEVNEEKEIVWEFFNTNLTGKNRELIATIPELIRVDKSGPFEWISERPRSR